MVQNTGGMSMGYKLKSGQINYESDVDRGAYSCIVIRDGVFHNLSEEMRLDLISRLQAAGKKEAIDFDDMF